MNGSVSRGWLLWGIGLFLLGMYLFEDTIKQIGKWWLKHVLQHYTNTLSKSVGVGFIQTFLFQSSTIVTMITLWFVGAGMIGMYNGLGVVLWANIGTTLTPWLVYLLWFKIDIGTYMLPIIGICGMMLMMTWSTSPRHKIARFGMWFALLFLWLDYMKTSVEAMTQFVDLSAYAHWWIMWFTAIGAIMTMIMQTSSGVTIIALTAVSSWLITLDMALAIVIGANIWSSLTTGLMWFLSSTRAQSTKKQVSLSHVIFNCSTAILVIIFFRPLVNMITWRVGSDDPSLVLAIFHTLFNVILLIWWMPSLKSYSRWVQKLFVYRDDSHQFAITKVNTEVDEEISQALHTDIGYLIATATEYIRCVLRESWPDSSLATLELYTQIKLWEEVLIYEMNQHLAKENLGRHVYETIDLYDDLLLDVLASAKHIKDMVSHYDNILDATADQWPLFYRRFCEMAYNTLDRVDEMLHGHYSSEMYDEVYHTIDTKLNKEHETFGFLVAEHTKPGTPRRLVSEIIKTHYYTMLSCHNLMQACYRYKKYLAKQ